MEIYKQGEGKLVRRVTFYAILALMVWGFKELGTTLASMDWASSVLLDFELPYYAQVLTLGLAIALVLNVVCAIWLFKILNTQRTGGLLIDTETEMRKVAWPSWAEAKHSTVIVLVFVAFCAVFLTASEFGLQWFFDYFLVDLWL